MKKKILKEDLSRQGQARISDLNYGVGMTQGYHSDLFKVSFIMFYLKMVSFAVYFDLGHLPDTQGYYLNSGP